MTGPRILAHRGTFAALGPTGDITGSRGTSPDGLFLRDARHVGRWRLTARGHRLTTLTAGPGGAVLVPPGTRDEPAAFTVLRDQAVGAGLLAETVRIVGNTGEPTEVVLELTAGADFADQFELRADGRSYAKPGAVRTTAPVPGGARFTYRRGGWLARTEITADPAPDAILEHPVPEHAVPEDTAGGADGTVDTGGGAAGAGGAGALTFVWRITLPPHGSCELHLAARAFAPGGAEPQAAAPAAAVRAGVRRQADAFSRAAPRPAGRSGLARAATAGLRDLAGLLVPAPGVDGTPVLVPGAGTPWFLTLFGRDSLLTSLFALPYRPALAAATLSALAAAQGTGHRADGLEQPGRIPHETRHGELAHFRQVPYGRYYGSVDATPLFLVLLHAHAEATGDPALARRLEGHARAAVAWMTGDGGLGTHGWLVYTGDAAAGGLANQNWKDSAGAVCTAGGVQATGAVAVAEAQGYAYDALRRTAALAAGVWGDPEYAASLEERAAALRQRFADRFWLAAAEFPALALDGAGRQADALASDAGHLLWSGILDTDRARRTGRRLLEPDFFSGWGVRTLAAGQPAHHPLSYHRGSVWPHDNAVIALGLARAGLADEAATLADALTDAARAHDWRLPEVIAGYDRSLRPWPVPYPHSCSPQAWAAATPLALLTATSGTATP